MNSLKLENVFSIIDKTAEENQLSPKETNILRLLSEETVSMADGISKIIDYDFFIENNGKNFELHFAANALITPEQKKTFVSARSKKQNNMTKGVLGKIKSVLENFFYMSPENVALVNYSNGFMGLGTHYTYTWSLNDYANSGAENEDKSDWDKLEKSILANFADDVIIGASLNKVEIIIKKQF